ncbi:MAG: hypothetical protein H6739_32475 [Alphaproteobacteria bacterium]|nr:hypothetical protein [Alphaproteobacteria bacterium]
MRTIGLIAEGHTDQVVLEQLLVGFFGDEVEVHPVQPQDAGPDANGTYAPGGWTVLFRFLREGGHREALQFNDLIVIHVDTDCADEVGFDVPQRDDPAGLAQAVEARLIEIVGVDFYAAHGHRVIFAVAVDEIECWLLPLLFESQKKKAAKTTGCLEAANHALSKRGEPRLSTGDSKDPKAYERLARRYRRRSTLSRLGPKNPSLHRFLLHLEETP